MLMPKKYDCWKFNYFSMRAYFYKSILSVIFLSILSSCINGKIAITTKPQKAKSVVISVSNIQIIDHQIIVTGNNLAALTSLVVKEDGVTTTLSIESNTNTSVVANTLANVTFAAGKILDFVFSNASAAATFSVNFSLCDSTIGTKAINCLIVPNDKEVLSYDATSGKWKPRSLNGLSYQGTWDASGAAPASVTAGDYYIVSVAGAGYAIGDWTVCRGGAVYDKIDNTNTVVSVFGRTGAVVAATGDYSLTNMGDVDFSTPPDNNDVLTYNGTDWVAAAPAVTGGTVTSVSGTSPIAVATGTTTPVISIVQSDSTHDGYLSSANWSTFNSKQSALTNSAGLAGALSDETGTGLAVFSAGPTFTGVPLAPTAAANTNTTQIATTAFVMGQTGTNITSLGTITAGVWNGTAIAVANGGTGATTDSGARTNLGLGTAAVANTGVAAGTLPLITTPGAPGQLCTLGLAGLECDLTAPTFTTNITSPLVIGGTATTSSLTYKTTTGVGTNGADHIFQVGNNGATEAMRILNNGNVGIGTTTPGALLDIGLAGTTLGTMRLEGNTSGYVQIQPAAAAGSWTITLPGAAGTNGQVLSTTGAGVLTWSTPVTGDASTTNPLSQFAATTSAQLAGVISDETGTGSAVFSASPTFTGVPAAPTAAASTNTTQIATTAFVMGQTGTNINAVGTITSGTWNGTAVTVPYGGTGATTLTANGILYGNGTSAIGATAAAAGATPSVLMSTLTTSVPAWTTSTAGNFLQGSVAGAVFGPITDITPGTNFTMTQNAVVPFTSVETGAVANTLYLKTGNVGIGNNNPGALLDIGLAGSTLGTMRLEGSTSGYVQIQPAAAAGSWTITLPGAAGTNGQVLSTTGAGVLTWANPGVGDALTTNPLSQFAATTSAQLAGVISDETGTGAAVFGTAPTFTTNITAPLVVGGSGTTSSLTYKTTTGVGTTGADHIFQVGNNGATEAMRILNNGNVGIGIVAPSATLSIVGNQLNQYNLTGTSGYGFQQKIDIENTAPASSFRNTYLYTKDANSSASIADIVGFYNLLDINNWGGGTLSTLRGGYNKIQAQSPTATVLMEGQRNEVDNFGNGLATSVVGTSSYVTQTTGASTLSTNAYAFKGSVTKVAGNITNGYGLYIDSVQATNPWSIYASDATAPSYFAGQVGIGTTTPGALLDIGLAGTTLGTMRLEGNTSGYVQIQPAAAAGSWTMTLPSAAGTNGQVLSTTGAGVLTWANPGVGDAVTTNPLSQFAATTSAQLAGVISDETGTGSAVFSASPTFTGVPVAPTAAASTNTSQIATTAFVMGQTGANITNVGTIASGVWNGTAVTVPYGGTGATTLTANGILYGNGTSAIGATAAAAGATPSVLMSTLTTSVPAWVTSTTGNVLQGSVAGAVFGPITNISPGADFTMTQNSVIPFTSVNAGAIVDTLYLKTGYVGILTNNPTQALEVAGNINVGSQTTRTTATTNRGQSSLASTYIQTVNANASVDWNNGNQQEINTLLCDGAKTITMTNTRDGAAYSLLLSGTAVHSGTCLFSAAGFTFKTTGGATAPTASKDVLFTFAVIGTTIVYNMIDNLQ